MFNGPNNRRLSRRPRGRSLGISERRVVRATVVAKSNKSVAGRTSVRLGGRRCSWLDGWHPNRRLEVEANMSPTKSIRRNHSGSVQVDYSSQLLFRSCFGLGQSNSNNDDNNKLWLSPARPIPSDPVSTRTPCPSDGFSCGRRRGPSSGLINEANAVPIIALEAQQRRR